MNDSVRLSVNVSPATATALKRIAAGRGIRITEAVRRAIAVWRFVEDEVAAGNRLAIITPDGTVRAVELLDPERGERP